MKSIRNSAGGKAELRPQKAVLGEMLLIAAMALNSLAVSLMIETDFGISAINSLPYVFNNAFPVVSPGIWNAVIQCAWFLIAMITVGKVKPGYLFSFILAFMFGVLLDTWAGWLHPPSHALIWRCDYFTAGFLIMSVGVSCIFCVAPRCCLLILCRARL